MRILITDHVHPLLIEGLHELGFEVRYSPTLDPSQFQEKASGFDGVIINSKIRIWRAIMDLLPDLKFIGRLGSGLEIIDLAAAAEKNIAVFSAPEGNCQAVAEHALGMLLSLFNKLGAADQNVRSRKWDREGHRGLELQGRTIGLIGFGHTGQAFARLLSGFDCRVLVNDVRQKDLSKFPNCAWSSVSQIQAEASLVSLHISYEPSAKHMVDKVWIDAFTQPFYLINTSRGMVIDTKAMVSALREGRMLGACLDVFENEKPTTFSPEEEETFEALYSLQNVILSPHVAGWTVESKEKIASVLLHKITQLQQSR